MKKFGEMLSDSENFKLSWVKIQEKLSRGVGYAVGKWELKKILQEFSVNVPMWFVPKDFNLQKALGDS